MTQNEINGRKDQNLDNKNRANVEEVPNEILSVLLSLNNQV